MLEQVKDYLQTDQLMSDWKKMLSPQYLLADTMAGITVAFIAIPLSLAIALASGVSPSVGLISAIIGGIVCGLFGGTNLAVSGPAAAMSVLIATIVEKYGVSTLIVVGLLAGMMQLVSGFLGLGRFARYVPLPVIAGFTAGIGVIIIIGQLPRAFGLAPPAESHVFDVLTHIKTYFHEINGTCLMLVVLTVAIIRGLPKLTTRVQPILPAVLITSLIVYFFQLTDVPLIGSIPRSLPMPHLPNLSTIPLNELVVNSFVVFLLASLETLLSSSAIDKMTNGKKHNSNQELIGQGLGNIAVSFFGGIPVTGVIARSATNAKAGAKTRRSSIIHSLVILITVYAIAPLIAQIPIAALAGVLFSVAFGMLDYREFSRLWKTTRAEGFIYAVTFLTIIFVDLLAGVQAGIFAACLIVLFKAARTHAHISMTDQDNLIRFSLKGSLTFLAAGKIAAMQQRLEKMIAPQAVVIDMSEITNMDSSGASAIVDMFTLCKEKKIQFYLKGLSRRLEPILILAGGPEISQSFIISEQELRQRDDGPGLASSHGRLVHGVYQFYSDRKYNDKRLFDFISKQQDPHTLFITCSDSRIIPSEITSSDPGELFIVRNVGNYIPAYDDSTIHSESAAIDFALNSLNITDIVVCGHASCGAIKACCSFDALPPHLSKWIDFIRSQLEFDSQMSLNEIAQQNVMEQIRNLKTYPVIQNQLAEKRLKIHGWFYDFDNSLIYEWSTQNQQFESLLPHAVST